MSMLRCLAACAALCVSVPALAQVPQFGQSIAPADIVPWDISIGPDGAGLPPGSGTARGAKWYTPQSVKPATARKVSADRTTRSSAGWARSRRASHR